MNVLKILNSILGATYDSDTIEMDDFNTTESSSSNQTESNNSNKTESSNYKDCNSVVIDIQDEESNESRNFKLEITSIEDERRRYLNCENFILCLKCISCLLTASFIILIGVVIFYIIAKTVYKL
ncbi:hypothetical protein A0H76_1628 [Hepatospora eriocheir]|uniref:Uncharacterized protein n=1 Tax=Hepatospora eriocheir TaxID=1081669 RepID=A0A1X0QGS1_9MICR|nr:hypothetical protein A0H76_1628 [Hepatospora eriocheir]